MVTIENMSAKLRTVLCKTFYRFKKVKQIQGTEKHNANKKVPTYHK